MLVLAGMNHIKNQSKDVNDEGMHQEQYNRNPKESQQLSDSDERIMTDDSGSNSEYSNTEYLENDNINMGTQQSRKVDERESSGLRQRNIGSSTTTNSQKCKNNAPQTNNPSTKGNMLFHVKQCCNYCCKLFSILIFVLTVLLILIPFFYFDYTSVYTCFYLYFNL